MSHLFIKLASIQYNQHISTPLISQQQDYKYQPLITQILSFLLITRKYHFSWTLVWKKKKKIIFLGRCIIYILVIHSRSITTLINDFIGYNFSFLKKKVYTFSYLWSLLYSINKSLIT